MANNVGTIGLVNPGYIKKCIGTVLFFALVIILGLIFFFTLSYHGNNGV
jgi:hypothetical protein